MCIIKISLKKLNNNFKNIISKNLNNYLFNIDNFKLYKFIKFNKIKNFIIQFIFL